MPSSPNRQQDMLPMQNRLAPLESINAEARTVEVVWTTGKTVRRRRFVDFGSIPYDETLLVTPESVDMSRLMRGAPVLDNHNRYTSSGQIAVVERAWLEGGVGKAVLRFPAAGIDEESDRFFALVKDGQRRNISVGYTVDQVKRIRAQDENSVEQWIVERWTPFELSFVPVPADIDAQVRSADTDPPCFPVTFTKEASMPGNSTVTQADSQEQSRAALQTIPTQNVNAQPVPSVDEIRIAERSRVTALSDLARQHGIEDAVLRSAIDSGSSLQDFRGIVLDAVAARSEQTRVSNVTVGVSHDSPQALRSYATEALAARMGEASNERVEVSEQARGFMRLSIAEIAATVMGERQMPRGNREVESVFERAFHTTSDFSAIFSGAINTRLEAAYLAAAPTYRRIARRSDFRDFRPHDVIRAGDFPMLQPVTESGEIKFGTFGEKKESVIIRSYGIQMAFTRQMLVNDDFGAIDQMLAGQGTTIGLFEEQTFFAMKKMNGGNGPVLKEDNKTVFHTDHGNLVTPASAITVAALSAMRKALRNQARLDKSKMNLAPRILLVGAEKETEAEIMMTNVIAQQSSNVNPFSGKLEVVVSGQVDDHNWEVYADQAFGSNWQWGLLEGYAAPRVRMEETFNTDGVRMRVLHDFGCGATDYRFGVRNVGAAPA